MKCCDCGARTKTPESGWTSFRQPIRFNKWNPRQAAVRLWLCSGCRKRRH